MVTKFIKTNQLEQFLIRELRQNVVDDIKKSISENGYLMSHHLTVVGNKIIDGNHRYPAAVESGITELPCVVYEEGEVNIYKLSDQLNASNDTYAKQDLFDILYKIGKLKDDKYTGKEIADILGWSQSLVSQYNNLNEKIFTTFFKKCCKYFFIQIIILAY